MEYSQAQDILEGRPPQPRHEGVTAADRPQLRANLALLAALAEHRRQGRLQVRWLVVVGWVGGEG